MSKTIQFNGTITIPDDLLPQDLVNVFKLETNTQDTECCQGFSPAPAPKQDLGKYAGKFIFVERVRKSTDTPQTYSNYNNGEYFCVRSTQNTLYAAKLGIGYDGHQLKNLNTYLGDNTESYNVLSAYVDDSPVRRYIKDQEKWIEDVRAGRTNKQWIESVYTGAENVLRQVKLALENRQ